MATINPDYSLGPSGYYRGDGSGPYVIDANGKATLMGGGGGGPMTSDQITDASDIGKAVLVAANAAAARTAIGAGTSNLAVGTTASTAKAGNYAPIWAEVTGKPVVIAAGADATAARAAIGAGTSSLALGTTAATAKAGNYTPPDASATVKGLVKQGAAVADATDEASAVTQMNALLASLRAAGVLAA